jgi:dienelactone hydrolase
MTTAETITRERVELDGPAGRLWGEIWRAAGAEGQPAVIWNHGSRGRRRGLEAPASDTTTALRAWLSLGLAVFAPSRRGYDGAEGKELMAALGEAPPDSAEYGRRMAERMERETEDVLVASDFLAAQPWVDPARLVCSGYSLGAIVTLLALSRTRAFAAGIAFALGAILWPTSEPIRRLILETAEQVDTPLMLVHARNDFSVAPAQALEPVLERRNPISRVVIYPSVGSGPDDGHVFCTLGANRWAPDVDRFLGDAHVVD